MKATIIWDENKYVWPVGTDPELDGTLVDGEQMKIMARVKEDGGEYVQIDADPTDAAADLGLPNASQFEIEFPVPRGKTLQVILIPVYQGVEGEASDPVEMFYPLLVPPKPAGVRIVR